MPAPEELGVELSIASTLGYDDTERALEENSPAKSNSLRTTVTAQDWIGPNDPENPQNWSTPKKIYHVLVPTIFAFVVSLGTSIISPAIDSMADALHASSEVALLSFSSYVLGLAFGPLLGSPMSEAFGRRAVYLLSIPISLLFTLGVGFAQNIETVIITRFFAGAFGGPVLAIGAGTNADLFIQEQRSTMTAVFSLAPFCATGIGPVIGAYVNAYKDWRWVEWTLIFFLVASYFFALFEEETYKKTILQRRAKKLNIAPPPTVSGIASLRHTVTVVLLKPIHMLFTEPIVTSFSVYISFNFSVLFSFLAAVPLVFRNVYGFTPEHQNLTFIGIFFGCVLALPTQLALDQGLYQKRQRKSFTEGSGAIAIAPEHRLYGAMLGSIGLPVGIFWFAWSSRSDIHWIVPIIALVPFAWGNLLVFISAVLYTVDVYQAVNGASAVAANGLLRYIMAAAFPLFTIQMYEGLGHEWASSLLGFATLALLPVPWALYRWGPMIRRRSSYDTIKA
ncbi:bicyclomycin resistance protein, putative [Talaromyces stipitatus ATCC 10500]|uniref:Bicyclomycin resistance protein, putative n=1 Tax=Talaromyces stipitatus (strain ATCC 10500 / CBS 375.48 / QM 6759 / NRRL 1006) TaxID=441959 RepID=B8LTV7_TALSN|nr:bicyclomycin resistance protein, putative [Talaromyces stipitatus ATCC 10500]EED23787.1 bicyclomycin resistance protein, putative [Talaromyces stipitatus ATCC 10500]